MTRWAFRAIAAGLAAGLAAGCLAAVDFEPTCISDSDCSSGLFCRDSHCSDTCDTYSDCGAGKQCSSLTSKCEAIPTCTAANAAVVCGKYACNTTTGLCYDNCQGPNYSEAPAQCAATSVCTVSFTCEPPCTDTYAPACAPYICDTGMGYCDDYCSVDADCANGYTCSGIACVL